MSQTHKTVAMLITVPCGPNCAGGGVNAPVCYHFDNHGGHGTCSLGFGPIDRDSTGAYVKPPKCSGLEEI